MMSVDVEMRRVTIWSESYMMIQLTISFEQLSFDSFHRFHLSISQCGIHAILS